MRNWNAPDGYLVLYENTSFEPTYEELKPPYNPDTLASRKSFEPTYEELKLW